MARHGGYMNGGYTNYQEMDTHTNDWNRPSYVSDGCSDHVCRPVIIDAEGRKRPIIYYTPNDSDSDSDSARHGPRADIPGQHRHTPVATEYKYTSPTKVEPYDEYGVVNNKWGRTSIPAQARPQKVEEFITTVQTEVSRPTRTGLLGTTNRRNPAGTNGYGEYNNYSNSDWNKPSRNTIHDESLADPFIVKKDGWGRESPKGWTNTPSHDTPLSRPTNDIGTAIEYLKEVVQSSSNTSPPTQPRFGAPISTVTRKEIYTETIDSREAAKRYGNFNFASRPIRTGETYTGTIDSREASMKYNGSRV